MASLKNDPPDPTDLEISLFGPGIGESVVVHLGSGDWIIVDSCRDSSTRYPIALRYLSDLAVDPRGAVRAIFASHFDSDHIRGLAEIVEVCHDAAFFCSAALRTPEFLTLIEQNRAADEEESSTSEFDAILQLLAARADLHRLRVAPVEWLQGGTAVRGLSNSTLGREVRALSPSSATITVAHLRIGQLLPRKDGERVPVPALRPNDSSLVLWVQLGAARAILGGDLETRDVDNEGWRAIVADATGTRAKVFKVPHHGAENAHSDGVWQQMLEQEPIALVTPYAAGRRKLPAHTDLARLCGLTPNVCVTSRALAKKPRSRIGAVERIANQVAKERSVVDADMGHVRVRIRPTGEIRSIEFFDSAYRACGRRFMSPS